MAPPIKQRPGRMLSVVALALVALYLGLFLGPAQKPALGLDLRGGIEVTLTAVPITPGDTITKDDLNQAVNILRKRINGSGVGGAEISTQGSNNIVVQVPGAANRQQVIDLVGETALLRFRQVLAAANAVPTPVTTTTPTSTPTSKSTAKAGSKGGNKSGGNKAGGGKSNGNGGKSSKKNNSGDAINQALLKKKTPPTKPTAKNKPTSSPTPTPTTGLTPTPTPTTTTTLPPGSDANQNGTTSKPGKGSQSATLSAAFTKSFEEWNCEKDPNPTNGSDLANDYIIACDANGGAKYLLAPADLVGSQVSTASADLNPSSQWVVDLKFTGSGSSAWLNLTRKTFEVTNSGDSGFSTGCAPPKGCNAIAITLDGVVESAPATQQDGIPGGNTQISGSFTHDGATQLANVLKFGSLPLKFEIPTARSVSATLGATQLKGGLIAGAIGLGLVVLFSLLYYRALGLVTVGSLAVSGLILYAVTTLLGKSSVGYTLSLPGIAGFIVAIGITADSFVVFFERIRDEIREGRRLRSAVDRGWPRARRTILSADTVSLLAAVILYVVSIGDVRGFAFTLGMSTLSDLFIVFFFTKPLLQVMAKWKTFDAGGGWTGIGSARVGVTRDAEPDRPRQRSTAAARASARSRNRKRGA